MSNIATHNIKPIRKGDTFIFPLEFWDDACKTTPIDVSSYEFKLKAITDAGVEVLLWDNTDFVYVDINKRTVTLTPTQTALLSVGQFKYDLQVTTDTGIYTWLLGYLTIEDQITS